MREKDHFQIHKFLRSKVWQMGLCELVHKVSERAYQVGNGIWNGFKEITRVEPVDYNARPVRGGAGRALLGLFLIDYLLFDDKSSLMGFGDFDLSVDEHYEDDGSWSYDDYDDDRGWSDYEYDDGGWSYDEYDDEGGWSYGDYDDG